MTSRYRTSKDTIPRMSQRALMQGGVWASCLSRTWRMARLMRCSPSTMLPSCRYMYAETIADFADSGTCALHYRRESRVAVIAAAVQTQADTGINDKFQVPMSQLVTVQTQASP